MALGTLWQIRGLGVYKTCKITDIWITHLSPESCLVPPSFIPTKNWLLNFICLLGNSLSLNPLAALGITTAMALASSIWQPPHWALWLPFCLLFYSQYCLESSLANEFLSLVIDHRIEFKLLPRAFDGVEICLSGFCHWLVFALNLSEPQLSLISPHP